MNVPFVDLAAQHREIAAEVDRDLAEVFNNAAFIGGPDVARFEREYADFTGSAHCVGVGNGTDAVEFALRAVGVGAGDEVIIPANTFVATAEAVHRCGAAPVVVDVNPGTLLIDPDSVGEAIGPRTRAIVPVHLYGQIAPVESIVQVAQGLPVVEDAAQSQGASRCGRGSGSLGLLAATSFYPGKNLGAAGDAGAVTTQDADLALAVRRLGAHGSTEKYVHESVGYNSRLDTVQAVVLRHKLTKLAHWNSLRKEAARRYDELIGSSAVSCADVQLPVEAEGNSHVWHLYVIQVPDRDKVLRRLLDAGIGAGLHYPVPVHHTPAFAGVRVAGGCEVAERASGRILSLPMFPHITAEQQERVVAVLSRALLE